MEFEVHLVNDSAHGTNGFTFLKDNHFGLSSNTSKTHQKAVGNYICIV